MPKLTVYQATPYQYNEMGSFGKARYMLLRQFNFPHKADSDKDILWDADHDRCFQWDYEHARRCFEEHTGKGDMAFEHWVRNAKAEEVFAFLRDILKAPDEEKDGTPIEWTGFRVMGTVNVSNGYPVWSLQLFANRTGVKTYSDENAPNVKGGGKRRGTCYTDGRSFFYGDE
jgi:hypothetical protein